MKNKIFHNPKCSKSREALKLLQEKAIEIEVVEYLKNPPSASELKTICDTLNVAPTEIIRSKEPLFKELGLSLESGFSAQEWCLVLAKHPSLIERPIVCYQGKVVIGRPPETVLSIL